MNEQLLPIHESISLPDLVAEKVVSCGKIQRLIVKAGVYKILSFNPVPEKKGDFLITIADSFDTEIYLHHGKYKNIKTELPCCFADTVESPQIKVSRWKSFKSVAAFADSTILPSWRDALRIRAESGSISGFRQAQVGAIHSVLAHWSHSHEPATVVLPTGTGKTETMLGLTIADQATLTVVVVPTKDLRIQIAGKFTEFGILKEIDVLSGTARFPVVGILKEGLNSPEDLSDFDGVNVLVTTPSLLQRDTKVIQLLKKRITHLYFDEAHHLAAASWQFLKNAFKESKIVQFTATPYRRDRKPIEGKVLYQYSLEDALKSGSFSPISLITVDEKNPAKKDRSIAEAAFERLQQDRAQGFLKHCIMVRSKSKDRAQDLGKLYRSLFSSEQIAVIYSGVPGEARLIEKVKRGEFSIIVCVDMLKEGFDHPEFKIAAVHDLHKSLAVTMQFIGRFARNRSDLGMAHVVVNFAEEEIPQELERLYAEGTGWEKVIAEVAQARQEQAVGFLNFLKNCEPFQNFDNPDQTISPRMVNPALSCVVFKCDREPKWGSFSLAFSPKYKFSQPYQHKELGLFYFATQVRDPVKWTRSEAIRDQIWNLIVLHYSESQKLLYIGYSDRNFKPTKLVETICEKSFQIKGFPVFRCFQDIKRLKIIHAGLLKPANRNHRYSKFSGSDVTKELEKMRNGVPTKKSDFVGTGFRDGYPVSVGASQKGKVWNPSRRDNTKVWLEWCKEMGDLLLDENISDDQLFKDTVQTVDLTEFSSDFFIVAMDWNPAIFDRYAKLSLKYKGRRVPFHRCEIQNWKLTTSTLDFEVFSEETGAIELRMKLSSENGFEFQLLSEGTCTVEGSKSRGDETLVEFFNGFPPTAYLADGSQLEGCQLNTFPLAQTELPDGFFIRWNWDGVDLKTESIFKKEDGKWIERQNSIQERVQREKKNEGAALVYNDDGAGESADVVAVFEDEKTVRIQLIHCKFSKSEDSGHRVGDLYEVCGQAVKSVKWRWNHKELFKHLAERRMSDIGSERRFYHGDIQVLQHLQAASDFKEVTFEFFIVQPGLKAEKIPDDLKKVIGTCNSAVRDMTESDLRFISS